MDKSTAAAIACENMKTVFAYALSRTDNPTDAEDVAQDILLSFLTAAPNIRDDRAVFGYLWTIAAHAIDRYRQNKAVVQMRFSPASEEIMAEIPSPDADFTETLAQTEETAILVRNLRREVAHLAKEYRICTVAYYFESLTCAQIAKREGISVEMVKYYLYKTRRILKEGMMMQKEYGEKSYRPAVFHFHTIFDGSFNREYRNLFSRKLPGNILYCAYYTPMSISELSVELGVAAVYLEDEITLLQKYNLLTVERGKVQTRLVMYTETYEKEFRCAVEEQLTGKLREILVCAREKMADVRVLDFPGGGKEDNGLLWALYFEMIRLGYNGMARDREKKEIYDGARGINFATDYDETDDRYSAMAFAGYYGLSDGLAANFADFGVLRKEQYFGGEENKKVYVHSRHGGQDAPYVYLCPAHVEEVFSRILSPEIAALTELYRSLAVLSVEILTEHTPVSVREEIPMVVDSTLFHRTVGLLGKMAVDTGVLSVPDSDVPPAVFLFDAPDVPDGWKGNMCD